MIVSSKDNELVKRVKKLNEKKYRDEYGEFIIEGTRMINEALEENAKIKKVLISESFDNQDVLDKIKNQEVALVSSHIFESISNVNTPQGILAIVEKPKYSADDIDYNADNFLLLDNLQDPGNLGTIIRTADSLDYKQIIVSKTTADEFNPKVIRSTMGASFRVKIIRADLKEIISKMKSLGIKVYATDLAAEKNIYETDFEKSAIVIGNEGNGVSKEVQEVSSDKIKIPMKGRAESLNAAVATSVILYEIYRKENFKS